MEINASNTHLVEDDYKKILWFQSIDLGSGIVTPGHKTAKICEDEFSYYGLTADMLRGKRVLDVGCNDGYMSLRCEELGADVVGIDCVYRDGLKYVRQHLKPKFKFYCIDLLSQQFSELGRFDVILYAGVLYHTVYQFEHILKLANACNDNAILVLESEYYNLPGFEDEPTLLFNYDGSVTSDLSSPSFPSIRWIQQTLSRVGFSDVRKLHPSDVGRVGRVVMRAKYSNQDFPILSAAEQI